MERVFSEQTSWTETFVQARRHNLVTSAGRWTAAVGLMTACVQRDASTR